MTVVEALPMNIQEALYHYCRDDESLSDALIRALRTELFRWHDLRKNPNDLPNCSHGHIVFDQDLDRVIIRNERFEFLDGCLANVTAWCEVAMFNV